MRPAIPDIGPQPPGLCLSKPCGQHRHRRIVAMQDGAGQDIAAQRSYQWIEKRHRAAHPVGQGGAVQVETFAVIDLDSALDDVRAEVRSIKDEML